MENKVAKIETKLEAIETRLGSIDTHLAVYNEQLKVHIEGTIQNRNALIKHQEETKNALSKNQETVTTEMGAIKKHIHMVEGGVKLLGLAAMIAGIFKAFNS